MESSQSKPRHWTSLAVSLLTGVILYWGTGLIWPIVGIDWKETYYPAVQAVLHGISPYEVPTYRNAPWTLIPLLPLGLFSESMGGRLYFVASLFGYAWAALQLKAGRRVLVVFLLSPPVVYGMRMLNVDVLVLLGFTLPAPLGLFFVLMKPQMGIALAFYWFVEAGRSGGIRRIIQTFAPISGACLASFLLFGAWPAGRQTDLLDSFWNASLWPWALPIGMVLIMLSLRDRREDLAMAASPFLSPYLAFHSWVSVLAGLVRREFEFIIAVLAMWFVAIIRVLGLG
jgi:hypothetical protein